MGVRPISDRREAAGMPAGETTEAMRSAMSNGWTPAKPAELNLRRRRQGDLDTAIAGAAASLLDRQSADGHWAFELEADATIPAELILLHHYLGRIEPELEGRVARFLRGQQGADGGWPLFYGGPADLSCSVKAYFALKAAGDPIEASHMRRARAAILAQGGARRCNVFTRVLLALFGEMPWHALPAMPVEIMLLPRWFPFHIDKVSYWSRTVLVPLLVLMALRPRARNPRRITIRELFVEPPEAVREWRTGPTGSPWSAVFTLIDRLLRAVEPWFPAGPRRRAIDRAAAFVALRLNGEDGLGGIFPAMVNSLLMFDCLGHAPDDPHAQTAYAAIRKLVARDGERQYCQPCLSPVWDTALACHALAETGDGAIDAPIRRALDWLAQKQVLGVAGDWAAARPGLRPGGWAFQYENAYYPDVDDTAAVAMILDRCDRMRYRPAVARAAEWILGMQSRNGGWGAFDADNTRYYLNYIPFADHGALLDPPTADVSARCLGFLAQIGYSADHPALAAAIAYLRREQEADGSWFGRWGTNYIYGTWSVLTALNASGIDRGAPEIRRAVRWLLDRQRPDGGWGESSQSYWPSAPHGQAPYSTASQTAWALLGLMAAGEARHEAVARGIDFLLATQDRNGNWDEPWFTAVGFPRIFYLRYHGYRAYFPLSALARYRRLTDAGAPPLSFGL
jgi:squalene-hopene/tetraprenyl-beta-curcumene cyclase